MVLGCGAVRAEETRHTFRLAMLVANPRPQWAAFFDELGEAGFIEGSNLWVDFRVQGVLRTERLVRGGAGAIGSRRPRDWRVNDRGRAGGDPDDPYTRHL